MKPWNLQVRQGGRRLVPLLIALGLLLALGVLLWAPLFPGLILEDGRTGEPLLLFPMKKGDAFSIRYTHSVNLSPVTDTLYFTGDALVLESTLFSAYGWGMPVLADGIGDSFENTPEGFYISGIHKVQSQIPILLQQVPDHRLLLNGREIRLLDVLEPGTFIRLLPGRFSLAARWMEDPYGLNRHFFVCPGRPGAIARPGSKHLIALGGNLWPYSRRKRKNPTKSIPWTNSISAQRV